MVIGGMAFVLALLCAAIMGLAIQRGGTCTVAAMEELMATRRPTRLLAMLEASLWVAGGLLLARQFGLVAELPAGFALTRWTVLGAVLLGLGAVINRACVVGAVARLGSGELAFAAMPLGFYVGCASADRFLATPPPQALGQASPVLGASAWLLWLLVALAAVRLLQGWRARRASLLQPWSPHAATAVIGVAFVLMLLLVGAWSYTDLLADLAQAMAQAGTAQHLGVRVAIGVALLAGALAGGWLTGQLRRPRLTAAALARCFVGGVLMGWGSLLTPGGNDTLVLVGMPLLWPYAWAAFATLCGTIAATRCSGLWLARAQRRLAG